MFAAYPEIRRPLWGHQACEVLCVLSAPPAVLPTRLREVTLTGGAPPLQRTVSSHRKLRQKANLENVPIWVPGRFQWDPQRDPKIVKICLRKPSKRARGKVSKKVFEKSPILTPSTCLNCDRGLQNQGFRIFEKGPHRDLQRLPFWKPFGVQNRPKTAPGGLQKNIQK